MMLPPEIVEIKVNGQLVTYDGATRTWTFTQLPLVLGGNLIQAEPATEWAM